MKREIKKNIFIYKAIDKETKNWVEGLLIWNDNEKKYYIVVEPSLTTIEINEYSDDIPYCEDVINFKEIYEVYPDTLSIKTSLTDIKDNSIYENDILIDKDKNQWIVDFNGLCFSLKNYYTEGLRLHFDKEIIKKYKLVNIGNIYDKKIRGGIK